MEKINIAEMLKDCPKGMELDCTICDNVYLDEVTPHMIKCYIKNDVYNTIYFRHDGTYLTAQNAKCVIFPKGKTTWEGFQRPFKDGDVVFFDDSIAIFKEWGDKTLFRTYVTKYLHCDSLIDKNVPLFGKYIRKNTRFATEEEKEKLFQAIKDNGYKWDSKTKTLEKLIEPKFKVGDRIKEKKAYISGIITDISGGSYKVEYGGGGVAYANIEFQDGWELVPNKFDITKLSPFDKVLVRCNSLEKWHIQFFEKYNTESSAKYPFICLCNSKYCQCIPYEGNEHLLGTTNDCDEYFKTCEWCGVDSVQY